MPRPMPVLALTEVRADGVMLTRPSIAVACVIVSVAISTAGAQLPPIRPLGLITAESKEPIANAAITLPMANGSVFVNDFRAHRVVLFDSSLVTYRVVFDSTSGKANSYGPRVAGLLPYRGDSVLFVDLAGPSMEVLDSKGTIIRTVALPPALISPGVVGGPYGNPVLDAAGRLVFQGNAVLPGKLKTDVPGTTIAVRPDSSPIVRFDFATHRLDTIATYQVNNPHFMVHRYETGSTVLATIFEPFSFVDDWVALADGSIAIVRGHDFRVEWINADGSRINGPKIPFDWERVDDAKKIELIDTTRAIFERQRTERIERGLSRVPPPPVYVVMASEVPDYRPAFDQASVRADADGNVWIRTTKQHDKKWLYYVVDRRGELIDRVEAPLNRFIIGFGMHNIVYLAVADSSGMRIDRARIH